MPAGEDVSSPLTARRGGIVRTKSGIRVVAMAVTAAVTMGATWGVAAQEDGPTGGACGAHTLKGDYGLVSSGVRGLGSGGSEAFVTISMVTYDGRGTFSATGVSHGATTGVRGGVPVTGTYSVNPDCTGGEITNIPGLPPIEDTFVIVDNGREVRAVVVSPATTIATANLRKK
jgi:hypothetical protein